MRGNEHSNLDSTVAELIRELESMNTIETDILAKKIIKSYAKGIDSNKDYLKRKEVRKELLNLFIKNIDKYSARNLKDIHKSIKSITEFVYEETKWNVSREDAIHQLSGDIFDPVVHYLIRYDSGYEIKDEASRAYGQIFTSLYGIYLDRLHQLYTEEENIMLGNYEITNKKMKYKTMKLITKVLGVEKPPKKNYYTKYKTMTKLYTPNY